MEAPPEAGGGMPPEAGGAPPGMEGLQPQASAKETKKPAQRLHETVGRLLAG
jgi:hypothetical protein